MSRLGPPPSVPGSEFGSAPPATPVPGAPNTGTPTPMAAPPTVPSGKVALNAGDLIEISIRLKNLKERNPEAAPFVEQMTNTMRDLQTILTTAAPPMEVAAPPV